jgi:RNA exonuclease 4
LDTFVAPSEPVEDYLTSVSGVTPDLLQGAPSFASVRLQIKELLKGRILIGHSVEKFDLAVCGISHPPADVRYFIF